MAKFKQTGTEAPTCPKTKTKHKEIMRYINRHKGAYMFMIPAVVLTLIFNYMPLGGLYLAFVDYDIFQGFSSPFIGFENIKALFTVPMFSKAILNTLNYSILNIVIQFTFPIIFALMLNELKNGFFKRFTQTVSYLPHFLSTIAAIGLVTSMLGSYGTLNDIRILLFGEGTQRELWLTKQNLFLPIVLIVNTWKTLGWSSIVYLATISGIDPQLYEAAIIDGASKLRQCFCVTIPHLWGTAIILLVMSLSRIFGDNFDLIYGLQNVFVDYETISTIVYKQGITAGDYSMATAMSFTQGIIGLALIVGTNALSKKLTEVSVF